MRSKWLDWQPKKGFVGFVGSGGPRFSIVQAPEAPIIEKISEAVPAKLSKPQSSNVCWHCCGQKSCSCSSCYQGLGGQAPCRACKGAGQLGVAIQ